MHTIFSLPVILTLLVFFQSPYAQSYIPAQGSESLIWGQWKYIGFIYRGEFTPLPNPHLVLTFDFLKDGSDTLRWFYDNEEGFCERKGEYSYDGLHLTDKIIWVNPKNSIECQRDPDMMIGKTQITPLRRINDQIHLDINLSDEILIYILALNHPTEPQPIDFEK